MEKKEIESLRRWCEKFFIENNLGFDSFDFDANVDSKLTLEENKTILRDKMKLFFNEYSGKVTKEKAEVMNKEKYELVIEQELRKVEKQAELEFNKVLERIEKDNTTNLIEEVYYTPKTFVKMVANGFSKGLILFGEAGLGKSYSVIRAFREVNKDFCLLQGHITPLELYTFLYEHRKENIILDDVNILESKINLNMLKSCLNDESRIVGYHTSSSRLKVPNKFLFEGSIIILLNSKPKGNMNLDAVESRILNYELKMDYKTKIAVIFELVRHNYKELSLEERQLIANWIRENTSDATENLNLRLLFACYEFYRYDKESWIRLARSIIENNEYKLLILQGLSQQEWCEETGLGRRSYFLYKKECKSAMKIANEYHS